MNRVMNTGEFKINVGETQDIEEQKIDISVSDKAELRKQLITRMENITLIIIQQICSGRLPQISYCLSQNFTSFDTQVREEDDFEVQFFKELGPDRVINETVTNFANKRSKDKFALIMTVMASAHRLLITNTTITRRSLYYDLKNGRTWNLAPEQRHLDQAVNHVANLLSCAPWELNLLATSKGLVAGELTLTLINDRIIDCTIPGGTLIPHIMSNVTSIRARAKMVLIVEKDAIFQKLLEDDCTSSLNCILVTGKGYPDVATRMLVKLLSEKLELPIYIIVDADPFGVDIMCVYRFGSSALSKEKESLACPNVRWLGVHPSELIALGVNTISLTEFDLSKLVALENRAYMTGAIIKELEIMKNGKAEIENVSSFSRKFLIDTYLPCKLKGDNYI